MTTEENIKVIVRIRPNLGSEAKNYLSKYKESNSIVIPSESEAKIYTFDKVSDETTSQDDIFQSCKELFNSFFSGYNCTIFAYGQTSSGKTYTMTGDKNEANVESEKGLVHNGLKFLFDKINENSQRENIEYLVKCSFVEIYNEQLFDLLDTKGQRVYLKVNFTQGVYVDQLTEKIIGNTRDALDILNRGLSNRHVASTTMNRKSSRSHAVFSIILESRTKDGDIENIRKSLLHLVDLAGSERQKDTKADGTRLKEAGSINRSLHVLGQVISAHVDIANGKERYIRYRESKLTQLLKDSIGGNSKTVLIACIHPDIKYASETLSTLQFANHVKMIKNKARVNIDVIGNVQSLQNEVLHLRKLLQNKGVFLAIQPQDYNADSIWKKRFLQAMLLRKKIIVEMCHLKDQLFLSEESQRKLEAIIDNLKDESHIKDMKFKFLLGTPTTEGHVKDLLDNLLSKLENERTVNTDRVKIDSYQSEISSLRFELHEMKSVSSLTMPEASIVSSLYKEFNDIIESGELSNQALFPTPNQLEISKLREELTDANNTISQLHKKIMSLKTSYKDERRQLESEVASMKTMLKSYDIEKENIASQRRQTLFNYIKSKPFYPLKSSKAMKLDRRNDNKPNDLLPDVSETNDSFYEFKSEPESEIDMLNNDLKEAQTKNNLYQKTIGALEYNVKEHLKDINELKSSLKDQEALEANLNALKEKYNSIDFELQESRDLIKKLETQLKEINGEKEKLSNNLNEKVSELKLELEDALLEKDCYKDELEVVKSSLGLLEREFLRSPFSNSSQKSFSIIKEDLDDDMKGCNSEEMFKLIEELSESSELISELKANESEYVDQIFDLETRLINAQNEIEELKSNKETLTTWHNKKIDGINLKHSDQITELMARCEMSDGLNETYRAELYKLQSELNGTIKELENYKANPNTMFLKPERPMSPINKKKINRRERNSLLDELLTTSEQLQNELQIEKGKSARIKSMLENIFNLTEISIETNLMDNISSLEAAIISYRKDIEDYRLFTRQKNDEISVKDNYIYELSKNLTEANELRQSLKEQNDALITSCGHVNYKQKIKVMTKLKDDLFEVRNENLTLSRKLATMTMLVNKCDRNTREFILKGFDENLEPSSKKN